MWKNIHHDLNCSRSQFVDDLCTADVYVFILEEIKHALKGLLIMGKVVSPKHSSLTISIWNLVTKEFNWLFSKRCSLKTITVQT